MALLDALARVGEIEARAASLRDVLARLERPAAQPPSGPTAADSQEGFARLLQAQLEPAPEPAFPLGGGGSGPVYPLATRGKVIGLPYQGTHASFGNWESQNAVDLAVPYGTPVYAVADGVIGDEIGSLRSSDPRLQGERLHLITEGNELYYAHLSRIVVRPGQRVRAGELLGYSGAANGVPHLHLAAREGSPTAFVG